MKLLKAYLICLLIVLPAVSCSKESGKSDSQSEEATAEQRPDQCADPSQCVSDQPVLLSGLPEFCSIVEFYGKTCTRCTPRELPLIRCGDVKVENFSPETGCTHLDTFVECSAPEENFKVSLDYAKIGLRERYYDNLPEFLSGIKLVVSATLKDQTEDDRVMIFGILDTVAKHKKAVFTGIGADAARDEIFQLLLLKNKGLDEEERKNMRRYVDQSLQFFGNGADRDVITSADVLELLRAIFSVMTAGDADNLKSKINIKKVEEQILSQQSIDMIDEMLKGLAAQ